MHNSLMGKMRLAFIDSDLLHRGALKSGLTVLGFSNSITHKCQNPKPQGREMLLINRLLLIGLVYDIPPTFIIKRYL